MNLQDQLKADSLPWLLEEEPPGARYLAMRDLLDYPTDDKDFITARDKAHTDGPIGEILAQMDEAGFWEQSGPGYLPKYRSTVWSIIALGQLGASVELDRRIHHACAYLLDHALTDGGHFSSTGTPGGTVDCLQGNLLTALFDLGYEDPRMEKALEWMARSVTGDGIAPNTERQAAVRYYAGQCGPGFACGANNKLPCAWGGIKVMLAFSKVPIESRTLLVEKAIEQGVEFLFSVDPATSEYPSGWNTKPSGNWWKFGFPVFYVTDLLQNVEALVGLGYGDDPRLANALNLIREKQDDQGRWPMEYSYTGKTWVDFGPKKHANKWVTLRALRVLKQAIPAAQEVDLRVRFIQVENEGQKQLAGALIREYLEWLNDHIRLEYAIEFDVETMVQSDLSDPDKFHPPDGRFYLAQYENEIAAVGCLKKLEEGVGEVQRMYVPSAFRGRGIGRAIAKRLIEDARSIVYQKLKLESLEFLAPAHALYRSLGFREIKPYDDNSMESYQAADQLDQYYAITVFMEMDLQKLREIVQLKSGLQ